MPPGARIQGLCCVPRHAFFWEQPLPVTEQGSRTKGPSQLCLTWGPFDGHLCSGTCSSRASRGFVLNTLLSDVSRCTNSLSALFFRGYFLPHLNLENPACNTMQINAFMPRISTGFWEAVGMSQLLSPRSTGLGLGLL